MAARSASTAGPSGYDGRARPGALRVRHEWSAAFAVLLVAVAAWAFATPLGAAPDEPAHLIRAASVARGQLLGKPLPHSTAGPTLVVEVPPIFVTLANDVSCFQWRPSVPAGCQQPLASQPGKVPAETYVGRYPPLYYAVVGLPTLWASTDGIYASRLVSGALSAALLALAVVYARRCRGAPLLAAGLALAVTPMTLFLAAVINPSGLEIASATAAWAVAMALRSRPPGELGGRDVAALFGPLVLLSLVRPLGPLWVVATGAALWALGVGTLARPMPSPAGFSLASRRGRAFLRRHDVIFWLSCLGAALAAALSWDLAAGAFAVQDGAPLPSHAGAWQVLQAALARLWLVVRSTVGQFGWLDTPSPLGVTTAWLSAAGVVVLAGFVAARWRGRLVTGVGVVTCAGLPVGLVVLEAGRMGVLGQGRDFMPLAVGLPIVAASLASSAGDGRSSAGDGRSSAGDGRSSGGDGWQRHRRRSVPGFPWPLESRLLVPLSRCLVLGLACCQVVDFYWALRRYTVGSNGPLNAFATVTGGWRAPIPAPVLVVVFATAIAAFAALLCRPARAHLAWPERLAEPPPHAAALAMATAEGLTGAAGPPTGAVKGG